MYFGLFWKGKASTVKILNIGTYISEQTVKILTRLLLRSSLIRIYAVCHSVYMFLGHYCIVKSNCFILTTTTVVSLGVPIFKVFMVKTNKQGNVLFLDRHIVIMFSFCFLYFVL